MKHRMMTYGKPTTHERQEQDPRMLVDVGIASVLDEEGAAHAEALVTVRGALVTATAPTLVRLVSPLLACTHAKLDLAEVNGMDTAGVAGLLLLARGASAAGTALSLVRTSERANIVMDVMAPGLRDALMDHHSLHAHAGGATASSAASPGTGLAA